MHFAGSQLKDCKIRKKSHQFAGQIKPPTVYINFCKVQASTICHIYFILTLPGNWMTICWLIALSRGKQSLSFHIFFKHFSSWNKVLLKGKLLPSLEGCLLWCLHFKEMAPGSWERQSWVTRLTKAHLVCF